MDFNTIKMLVSPKSTSMSSPVKYRSPSKSSTWMSNKDPKYCTMFDISTEPLLPWISHISVNDTNFNVFAQIKNLGVILGFCFLHTQLIYKHILNPHLYYHPSLSSPMMLQPHWPSFCSSTTSSLLFTLIITDHSHSRAFVNSFLCFNCSYPNSAHQ